MSVYGTRNWSVHFWLQRVRRVFIFVRAAIASNEILTACLFIYLFFKCKLDAENSALTSAARSVAMPPVDTNNSTVVDETVEANLDASMLVDKILHLKDLLRNANEKSDKPINICGETTCW